MYIFGSGSPAVILDCSAMLFGGVYIFMPQYIGHQINITRFLIESRAVGTAELMRGYFLLRCYDFCIFFNKIFNRSNINSFILQR